MGLWVFEKPEFTGWDNAPGASFLWIHGIPGAGKTKLLSSIVDHFLQLREAAEAPWLEHEADSDYEETGICKATPPKSSANSDLSFAFFYCRRAESERRKPENVLCSYLKQMALTHEKSLGLLRAKYLEKKQGGFLSNVLGLMEIQEMLVKMIKLRLQTVFVLDALDECEEDSRHSLMTILDQVVREGLSVKILISSRRDDDITAQFVDKANFNISATDNGEDIMSFVRSKLEQHRNSKIAKRRTNSVISRELEQQIIDVFLDKSNGMFQWAAMHIAHILSLDRPSDIAKALPKLPRGLEKTYDEIFERIMSQEEGLRDIALRTFHWMLSQGGTSEVARLLTVVCQDPDSDTIQPVDIDPEVVLKACQNLIVEEGYSSAASRSSFGKQSSWALEMAPPFPHQSDSSSSDEWSERPLSPSSSTFPSSGLAPKTIRNIPLQPFSPLPDPRFPPLDALCPPNRIMPSSPLSPPLRGTGLPPTDLQPPRMQYPKPQPFKTTRIYRPKSQFRFAHLSVQEYCERFRWTPQAPHCFAAKICLLFLSQLQEQGAPESLPTDLDTEFPQKYIYTGMRDFADSFWIYHTQRSCTTTAACQDKKLIASLTSFLEAPRAFQKWLGRFIIATTRLEDSSLHPAFWSINDKRKTAAMWDGFSDLQFFSEPCLLTWFLGLDRMFTSSTMDDVSTAYRNVPPHLEARLSVHAWFSHMSSIPTLHSVLKSLDKESTTQILWHFVYSIRTHPLRSIYMSSFLDYSTLCLNLAELIQLLEGNHANMYGNIASSLLYPGINQPSPFASDGRVWTAFDKLSARGANLIFSFREALLAKDWQNMIRLFERGAKPDRDSLARILAHCPYDLRSPPFDLCQAVADHGADASAMYQDPHHKEWSGAPLIAASIMDESALVHLLLTAGANVNAKPHKGDYHDGIWKYSPADGSQPGGSLQLEPRRPPCCSRTENVLPERSSPGSALLKTRDKGIWYGTALIEACARGHEEICQMLVTHGADVHAQVEPYVGRSGTALVAACAYNNPDICRILLEYPSLDVTTVTWRIPRTTAWRPFYTNALVTAASSGALEICQLLIERGADVNAVPLDKTGRFDTHGTALIRASCHGHLAVCMLLVERGADVNAVAHRAPYPTALLAAAGQHRKKVIEWLLKQGAEINKRLLLRFPGFVSQQLAEMLDARCNKTAVEEDRIVPPWFWAENPDNDVEDTEDIDYFNFEVHKANGDCTITVETASKLAEVGIRVNPDAIRPFSATESDLELAENPLEWIGQ